MSEPREPKKFREYTDEQLTAAWEEMARRDGEQSAVVGEPHAVFRVGRTRFALPAKACRGVVSFRMPTPLPSLPRYILGVVAIRGRPMSVTDLRSLLGLEGESVENRGHLLLIRVDDGETALKVDWVENILPVDVTKCGPVPPEWKGNRKGLVTGALIEEGVMSLVVLDPQRCLKAEN